MVKMLHLQLVVRHVEHLVSRRKNQQHVVLHVEHLVSRKKNQLPAVQLVVHLTSNPFIYYETAPDKELSKLGA